jgi:hypothetical protein
VWLSLDRRIDVTRVNHRLTRQIQDGLGLILHEHYWMPVAIFTITRPNAAGANTADARNVHKCRRCGLTLD